MNQCAAWDSFWKYDRLSSFLSGPGAGNYGPPIADGWRAFFARLPNAARVIDLCTGNGAIAVMAVEAAAAAGKRFEVTGCDLADVQPAAFVSSKRRELRQIRFMARTSVEELPLADASFDAVVSQYGIEYSDMGKTIAEAARLLAPGGGMRFACHASEGSVAADTRRALADADFLIELDITGRASRCFETVVAVERGPNPPDSIALAAARVRLAAFQDGLRAVENRLAQGMDKAMLVCVRDDLASAFARRQSRSLDELAGRAAHLQAEIVAHQARQRALLDAAVTAAEMTQLGRALEGLGLTDVTRGEQRDGPDLVGWTIEARKPS